MKCPECNSNSLVLDTKENGKSVHRKHKCKECGLIFFTRERLMVNGLEFYAAAAKYQNAINKTERRKNYLKKYNKQYYENVTKPKLKGKIEQ